MCKDEMNCFKVISLLIVMYTNDEPREVQLQKSGLLKVVGPVSRAIPVRRRKDFDKVMGARLTSIALGALKVEGECSFLNVHTE